MPPTLPDKDTLNEIEALLVQGHTDRAVHRLNEWVHIVLQWSADDLAGFESSIAAISELLVLAGDETLTEKWVAHLSTMPAGQPLIALWRDDPQQLTSAQNAVHTTTAHAQPGQLAIDRADSSAPPATERTPYEQNAADTEHDSTAAPSLLNPGLADLSRLVHLFAGREDVHARQWSDPSGKNGYAPVRAPMTPELMRSHLTGAITLGAYGVRVDQTVTWFVWDIDIRRRALRSAEGDPGRLRELRSRVHDEAMRMYAVAWSFGLRLLMEDSGFKGRHLWGFCETPQPADLVRHVGRALTRVFRPLHEDIQVEFFPKQARIQEDGLGNLVKVPLGLHRVSGRRSAFLDVSGTPVDPLPLLHQVQRVSRDNLLNILELLRAQGKDVSPDENENDREPPDDSPPDGPDNGGRKKRKEQNEHDTATPRRPALKVVDLPDHRLFGPILEGCAVLAELLDDAVQTRRLTYDEQVVLAHSWGHLPDGVEAVNAVLDHCPESPAHTRLSRAFRGHPISCNRIRQRLPHRTARLPCHCTFHCENGEYPTPGLHARPELVLHHDRVEHRSTGTWGSGARDLADDAHGTPDSMQTHPHDTSRTRTVILDDQGLRRGLAMNPAPPFVETDRPHATDNDTSTPEYADAASDGGSSTDSTSGGFGSDVDARYRALLHAVALLPGRRIETPDGEWRLVEQNGVAHLLLVPRLRRNA